MWAAFSVNGRITILRIDGNLNKDKYIEILKKNLLPFAEKCHGRTNELIYQQHGCGPHKSKAKRYFLDEKGIELLPRLAQSPDMNPIENGWVILKRNLRQQSTYPKSEDLLFSKLAEVWYSLQSSYFE